MNLDRYTVKSQEALDRAQRLARERGNPELLPEHMLAALLTEPEGTIAGVLQKLGVPRETLGQEMEQAIARLPRAQGSSLSLSEALRTALEAAEDGAARLKDEYVSVEHLLMALAVQGRTDAAARALAKARDAAVADPEFVSLPRPAGERRDVGAVPQRDHDLRLGLPDGTVVGWGPVDDDPTVWHDFLAVPEEPGSHVVLLDSDTVLMSSAAPRTRRLYEERGLRVVAVDISEYEKLEGCVTCLSVRLRD